MHLEKYLHLHSQSQLFIVRIHLRSFHFCLSLLQVFNMVCIFYNIFIVFLYMVFEFATYCSLSLLDLHNLISFYKARLDTRPLMSTKKVDMPVYFAIYIAFYYVHLALFYCFILWSTAKSEQTSSQFSFLVVTHHCFMTKLYLRSIFGQ